MFVKSTQSGSNSITIPMAAYVESTGSMTSEQRDAAQKAAKLAEAQWAADNVNVQKTVTAMFDGGVVSHLACAMYCQGPPAGPAHYCQKSVAYC
jgi:hypothetical protein